MSSNSQGPFSKRSDFFPIETESAKTRPIRKRRTYNREYWEKVKYEILNGTGHSSVQIPEKFDEAKVKLEEEEEINDDESGSPHSFEQEDESARPFSLRMEDNVCSCPHCGCLLIMTILNVEPSDYYEPVRYYRESGRRRYRNRRRYQNNRRRYYDQKLTF